MKRIFCEVETVAVVYVDKAERPTSRHDDTTYKVRLANIFKGPKGKKNKDVYSFRSPPEGMCGVRLEERRLYLVALRNYGQGPRLEICDQFFREGQPERRRMTPDLKKKLNKMRKHKCQ
ncbi:hypothetical protein AB6A40_010264 [Gnathostoma spinigerum]|uniref:NTR domain-containing protein n=1 Tax=Gnathostoma spinigerum TaxID=75299 RepID=A0ABD6EUA8_9BILA